MHVELLQCERAVREVRERLQLGDVPMVCSMLMQVGPLSYRMLKLQVQVQGLAEAGWAAVPAALGSTVP